VPASLALTLRSNLDAEPDQIEPGRSSERGATLWFSAWRHERAIEVRDGGCTVVDRVVAEPYLPGAAVVALPLLARRFEREHSELRRAYGTPDKRVPKAERTLAAGAEQEAAVVAGGLLVVLTVVGAAIAYLIGRSQRK